MTLTTRHKAFLIDLTIDKEITEFLNTQKKSTRVTYSSYIRRLKEYDSTITGSKLLEDHDQWIKRIFEFQQWLMSKGYSKNYAESACGCVRGFFMSYRKPLVFTRSESRRLAERSRATEDYRFTKDDIQRMANVGNLKERWVLLVGKSLGLRAEDFSKITYGQLRSMKLDSEVPIALGEIATEKESIKAYPFIDSDALPVVKTMLETNTDKLDSHELWTAHSQELSYVLQSLAKKANIQKGSKRIRFHGLRKFLIDALSSHMSESKWKMIIGKAIAESAYVNPDNLRECYKRAMKDTCFNYTNGNAIKNDLQRKLEEQIALNEVLLKKLEALTISDADNKTAISDLKALFYKMANLKK